MKSRGPSTVVMVTSLAKDDAVVDELTLSAGDGGGVLGPALLGGEPDGVVDGNARRRARTRR